MKLKSLNFFIAGLMIMLMLASGCNGKASSPNIEAQQKVINTYMEGLKFSDKNKILQSVTPDAAQEYQLNPASLKKVLDDQKTVGAVKQWKIVGEPYVDELNNQSLIEVTAVYPKTVYQLQFDLRRMSGIWGVLSIKVIDPSSKSNTKN